LALNLPVSFEMKKKLEILRKNENIWEPFTYKAYKWLVKVMRRK